MSELVLEKELPKGWTSTQIGDIVTLINGRAFKPEDWSTKGLPIVRIQNLNDPSKKFNYCDFKVDKKFLIDTGQLLFAWSGTPGTSFGSFIWKGGKAVLNQHIFRVEINEKLQDKKYLLYAMNQNLNKYVTKAHGTAGLAHITKGMFEEGKILLPPLNEQKRIVAKIEQLFSYLEKCSLLVNDLKKQLEQYRRSILFHAFSGEFTRLTRAKKTCLENIHTLEEIHKLKINYEKKFLKIYSDEPNLPVIPKEWVWTTVGLLSESMKNGIYKPKSFYNDNGIACLRMYNIDNGELIWKDIKRMNISDEEKLEYELKPDDLLVNRVNSRELVGKTARIPEGIEKCVFESKNIRLRLLYNYVNSRLMVYWFLFFSQNYFNRNAQQTVGMASINQDQIGDMPFPYMHKDEQDEIVANIELHLTLAKNILTSIQSVEQQIMIFKKGILQNAFEGKLVPQDPNDEPAEILLRKIKQEKQKIINSKPRRKKDDK